MKRTKTNIGYLKDTEDIMYSLKSARLFRYERSKCALVLESAACKYRKRSIRYGEKLKASIVNNSVQFGLAVERVLRI